MLIKSITLFFFPAFFLYSISMKKISIHRVSDKPGAKGYTPITNSIIQGELSLEASGLLCYLLSLPQDFTIVQKNIMKKLKGRISSGGFRSAWKKLVEMGYIVERVYYRQNLKRVGWEVFENPEPREFQNRESREPISLQSTQLENKQVESNQLESTDTITNILGENSKSIPTGKKGYGEIFDELCNFLVTSTLLGENILTYTDPKSHEELIRLIGKQKFEELEYKLLRVHSLADIVSTG
jgi:hypothetical protein